MEHADRLFSTSSSPAKNKKKEKQKSMQEIIGNTVEKAPSKNFFKEKYIVRNPEWEDHLKINSKKCKRKGIKISDHIEVYDETEDSDNMEEDFSPEDSGQEQ